MFLTKINISFYFFIIISVFFHILFVRLHPVNLEELFLYAAETLKSNGDLSFYFKYQGNTLLYSKILAFLSNIFFFLDLNILSKLFVSSGYIFIGAGILSLKKNLSINNNYHIIYLSVILNPIIWNLGYRGTPDFISLAIGFLGMCVSLRKVNYLKFIGYFLIGFAIAMKPHSILFLIFLLLYNSFNARLNKKFLIENAFFFLFVCIVPLFFYINNYLSYNFILLNKLLQNDHSFTFKNILPNLISYFGILTIFCFPLFLKSLYDNLIKKNYKFISYIFYFLLIFLPLSFYLDFNGEIYLGFLSGYINKKFYLSLITAFSIISIFFLHKFYLEGEKFDKTLSLSCFIYIFLLSFSRPSDRYLIFLIPFITILYRSYFLQKKFLIFVLIFYTSISIVIFLNYFLTSKLTERIKYVILNENIENITDMGALFPHAPVFKNKYGHPTNLEFKLLFNLVEKSQINECLKFFIFKKCYSIVKIR